MRKTKKAKKIPIKKLESKVKIRRRLSRLWSEKVALLHSNTCAMTGTVKGTIINGKPAILDAHHVEHRTCQSLRYNATNGILLTKSAHKFGRNSAHRGMIYFAEWLRTNRPLQYAYVLEHRNDPINLDDRDALYALEAKLKAEPTDEELEILGVKEKNPTA